MLKLFGIVFEILLCALAGSIGFVIIASIVDFFRSNKNQNAPAKQSNSSSSTVAYDAAYKRMNRREQLDHNNHSTASRMAQEAHDTAVRDSQWLHDDVCRMAYESHDTAVYDHQAAVDCHEQFSSPPDFGVCNPFF